MTKNDKKEFDLEDRTSRFSEDVISFLNTVEKSPISIPLISQLVRSATSVGANYFEANNAFSRADFKHKISLCKKEARESAYWLKIFTSVKPNCKTQIKILEEEANQLNLIFNSIILKIELNDKIKKLVIT